jgi:hypothetical protein
MDIEFYCLKCGQHVVIDEAGVGLQVECPKCGQSLSVPKAAGFTAQSFTKLPLPPKPSIGIPPVITKSIAPKPPLVIGLGAGALLILGLILVIALFTSPPEGSPSKGASPQAYDLGYNCGITDAVYPADALTHSVAERESLAQKVALAVYHVEDAQVTPWVDSFMKGYANGNKEYNNPSKRVHVLGFRAGTEMCQQGAVKPSADVLDAMARQAVGTRDSYMWKVGFEQGWDFAHGL